MSFGTLEIALGSGETTSVTLDKRQVMIGRDPATDIPIEDNLISRQHALLLCEPEGVRLVDVGSSNGTFVGNERLAPRQPVPLSDGMHFRVGKTVIRFLAPVPEEKPKPKARPVKAAPAADADTSTFSASPAASSEPVEVDPQAALSDTAMRLGLGAALPPSEPPISSDGSSPAGNTLPPGWTPAAAEGRSSYLRYLPALYSSDEFMGRFLLIFESIYGPLDRQIDQLHWYLDPHLAPPEFLPWLASWLGLALAETWPEARRRELISSAVNLYQWRGTRRGLSEFIRLYTGCTPEIVEPGVTDAAVDPTQAHRFIVRVQIPENSSMDRNIIQAIIETEKPAHTAYTLELVEG